MIRIKPILPSLREKKRYLVYKVISNENFDANEIEKAIRDSYLSAFGEIEAAKAGLIFLNKSFDKKRQKGIVKTSHKCLENLRYAMAITQNANNKKCIISSIGCSGIIKKTKKYFS